MRGDMTAHGMKERWLSTAGSVFFKGSIDFRGKCLNTRNESLREGKNPCTYHVPITRNHGASTSFSIMQHSASIHAHACPAPLFFPERAPIAHVMDEGITAGDASTVHGTRVGKVLCSH